MKIPIRKIYNLNEFSMLDNKTYLKLDNYLKEHFKPVQYDYNYILVSYNTNYILLAVSYNKNLLFNTVYSPDELYVRNSEVSRRLIFDILVSEIEDKKNFVIEFQSKVYCLKKLNEKEYQIEINENENLIETLQFSCSEEIINFLLEMPELKYREKVLVE